MRDRRRYSPVSATIALDKRAEAVAPGAFTAELRHLRWLAERLVEAERSRLDGEEEAVGRERDYTREFGLQLRATTRKVGELEDRLAAQPTVMSEGDWKALMGVAGDAG